MEEKLLELFKIANEINEKQEKIYAQIVYSADDYKKLDISIVSKENYSYIEKCSVMLAQNPIQKLDVVIKLLNEYNTNNNEMKVGK